MESDRLCLICDKPLSEYNKRPVCYCHEVEGQLTKKQIEELRKRKGVEPEKEKIMPERGTCSNCERPDMMLVRRDAGDLCGSCSRAITRVSPENYATVLAAAREKYRGKGKMTAGKKARRADPNPIPPCAPQARAVITAGKRKSGEGQKPAKVESFGVPCTIKVYVEEKEILAVAGRIEVEAA